MNGELYTSRKSRGSPLFARQIYLNGNGVIYSVDYDLELSFDEEDLIDNELSDDISTMNHILEKAVYDLFVPKN